MTKQGGIRDVVSLFQRKHESQGWRFMSPETISTELNISIARIMRIIGRGERDGILRRSTGSREVYTLTSFTA